MTGTGTIQLNCELLCPSNFIFELHEHICSIHNAIVFATHRHNLLWLHDVDILIAEEGSARSVYFLSELILYFHPYRLNRGIAVEYARFHGLTFKDLTIADLNGSIPTAAILKTWLTRIPHWICLPQSLGVSGFHYWYVVGYYTALFLIGVECESPLSLHFVYNP